MRTLSQWTVSYDIFIVSVAVAVYFSSTYFKRLFFVNCIRMMCSWLQEYNSQD